MRARSAGLVIRDLQGELIVYDTLSHEAHCLNSTAAFVFRHADGRRTAAEIAALLAPGADDEVVQSALDQLAAAALLESQPVGDDSPPSRREVLRQVGRGAALLAPVVISLLVPTPAQAAASCIPAAGCTSGNVGQPCYHPPSSGECLIPCTCTAPSTCTC